MKPSRLAKRKDPDVFTQRMGVVSLLAVSLAIIVGAVVLAVRGQPIPEMLPALGGVAVTTLATFLRRFGR